MKTGRRLFARVSNPASRFRPPEYTSLMSTPPDEMTMDAPLSDEGGDIRTVAATYVEEAFAEARHDGLDGDCLAHAALFAAFRELVTTYGEDAVAIYAEGLSAKIKGGAYSSGTRH